MTSHICFIRLPPYVYYFKVESAKALAAGQAAALSAVLAEFESLPARSVAICHAVDAMVSSHVGEAARLEAEVDHVTANCRPDAHRHALEQAVPHFVRMYAKHRLARSFPQWVRAATAYAEAAQVARSNRTF